jgi:hypothetical protein
MNEAVNYPQQDNTDDETLGEKLALVLPYLNERQQRLDSASAECGFANLTKEWEQC